MSVARSSGPTVNASSFHLGCCDAAARPLASTAASAMIPGCPAAASASKAMMYFRPGSSPLTSRTLSTCPFVEQNAATDSESRRMYSVCLAVSVG